MNWIDPQSGWGTVDGFSMKRLCISEKSVELKLENSQYKTELTSEKDFAAEFMKKFTLSVTMEKQIFFTAVPYIFEIVIFALLFELIRSIRLFCEQKHCEVQELNVQADHVHMILLIPPKESISDMMGILKGRTAIHIFRNYPNLKTKPYWGDNFKSI